MSDLHIPAHSIEAEQALLGAILLDNAVFDDVADMLSEVDFYGSTHAAIWSACVKLIGSGKTADAVTVAERLTGPERENVGQLAMNCGSTRNAKRYAEIIRERSVIRRLAGAANRMYELAMNPLSRPSAELLEEAQGLLTALTDGETRGDAVVVRAVVDDVLAALQVRQESGGAIQGLPTGLTDLDEITNGLQRGDLVIVAGRPSMGKTALAMQVAQHTALGDKTALVFSLEMGRAQLVERTLSNIGRVNSKAMRSGRLNAGEWECLSAAVGRLHDKRLFVDDTSGLNPTAMRAKARRIKRKHGLDLIVVDYIGLMDGEGEKRWEIVTEIVRALKRIARELDVPLVALAQLSRKVEERTHKRPVMSDLRESGAIEEHADLILLMYRDEYYNAESEHKGVAEIIVGKQRMGETGTRYAVFEGEYSRFSDMSREWRPVTTSSWMGPTRKRRGMDE